MSSSCLQIDDAHGIAEHVQDIELPICQSQGGWALELVRWLWRQTSDPIAIQVKNGYCIYIGA